MSDVSDNSDFSDYSDVSDYSDNILCVICMRELCSLLQRHCAGGLLAVGSRFAPTHGYRNSAFQAIVSPPSGLILRVGLITQGLHASHFTPA